MDFIYAKFDNNLVDINRIDKILLLKCEQAGNPISSLKVGDYYLKITIVDSNKISYCDLSALNIDDKNILDKLNAEIIRATNEEKNIKLSLDEKENGLILKINTLEQSIDLKIATLTENTNNEIINRNNADKDIENKIDKEVSDRKDAIENLTALVNDQIKELQLSDSNLNNKIITEINARKENLEILTNNINDEKTLREQRDNELAQNISNEENRAIEKENSIDEKFTANINDLTADLNSEIGTREAEDTALKNDVKILDKKIESTKKELSDNISNVKAELEASIESTKTDVDNEINNINEILPIIVYLNTDFIDLDRQIEETDPNYSKIKNAIKEQAQTNKPLIFIEKSGYQYVLSYVDSKPLTSSDEFYNYYFSCVDENTVYYLNIAFNDISYKPLLVDYTYITAATSDEVKDLDKKLTDEISRAKKVELDLNTKKQDQLIAGDNITIVNNKISTTADVTKNYVDEKINELLDAIADTTSSLEETLTEKITAESTTRKENNAVLTTQIFDETTRATKAEDNLQVEINSLQSELDLAKEKIKILNDVVAPEGPNTLAGLIFEEI